MYMKDLDKLERPLDVKDLRRSPRDLVDFVTGFTTSAGSGEIRIINISRLGLMGRTTAMLKMGDRILLTLPHVRMMEAVVRWAEDGRIGTEFLKGIPDTDYDAMLGYLPRRQQDWG